MKASRLLLAGALLCASFLPASAQATEGCASVDKVTAIFEANSAAYTNLSGDHRDRALAFVREAFSDDTPWDLVFIAVLPSGSGILAVGIGTEVCKFAVLPEPVFAQVVRAIYGQGA